MGKDKSKKRRRSDYSGSDSGDDSSSDSEREEARREKKHSKKHKKEKEKSKDKKKSGKSKSSKDDLIKKARAFLEHHLAAGGGGGDSGGAAPPCSAPFGGSATAGAGPLPPVQVAEVKQPIADEDYFLRHAEFSAFLAEERRTQFNDLSSERARELFSEFVRIWNEGRLAPRYYAGLVAAPKRRTEYRWNIGPKGAAGGGAGPSTGLAAFVEDQRAQQVGVRQEARRQDRGRARELLEEVAPRETGRDKMVAERAARRQLARSGDDDGPGGFVPGGGRGDDLMGGGDSFEAAKARESRRTDMARQRGLVRAEETAQRAAAYQAKEDEKLAGLRALLAKGPITIAKRS